MDANVIVVSGTCTYTSLVKGSQATAFLASLSVQVVQHFLGFMSLGYVFLNGAPPPAWGLQECLREVNLMEISINSSIFNIFEPQLSTKRFFNNNGKKELINSSFHIDKFYIFLVFRRFPGLKSPTKSAYYVDFSFGSISCPVKKSRVQSNLPECRLVVKFNN